jgi:hypothetical protein
MNTEFKLIKSTKTLKINKLKKIKKTKHPLRKAILRYKALKRIIHKIELTRENLKKNKIQKFKNLCYPLYSRKHRVFRLFLLYNIRTLKKQLIRIKFKESKIKKVIFLKNKFNTLITLNFFMVVFIV